MIPYANATLTGITAVGVSDDYDTAATTGTSRWAGSEPVYVAEEILEELTDGRVDQVQRTRLEIPYRTGKLVKRGDTLTFTFESTTQTGVAGTLNRAPLVGRVKVLLEDR